MKTRIFFILLSAIWLLPLHAGKQTKLVILHTNDTHSQVEPIESSDLGGYARRIGVINKIRSEEKNVLLLDAGDFLQGTPYYNFYGGRVEAKALQMMKYDAVTLGNHEFDNGMDSLAAVLAEVDLPLVSSNYDFQNTPLKPFIEPYKIIRKGGIKIGIMGLGIELKGLAFQKNFEGLKIGNPILTAQVVSDYLKNTMKCDLVVCLSHLGVSSLDSSPTDYDVASATQYIDVIIGGHSHKIIENETVQNAIGKPVIIAQMGKSGLYLGRIDFTFERK
ncbi:MAG: bifunctional metallophosphatase/5'-nucleotidase [Paludibacteraceae bacterium]